MFHSKYESGGFKPLCRLFSHIGQFIFRPVYPGNIPSHMLTRQARLIGCRPASVNHGAHYGPDLLDHYRLEKQLNGLGIFTEGKKGNGKSVGLA